MNWLQEQFEQLSAWDLLKLAGGVLFYFFVVITIQSDSGNPFWQDALLVLAVFAVPLWVALIGLIFYGVIKLLWWLLGFIGFREAIWWHHLLLIGMTIAPLYFIRAGELVIILGLLPIWIYSLWRVGKMLTGPDPIAENATIRQRVVVFVVGALLGAAGLSMLVLGIVEKETNAELYTMSIFFVIVGGLALKWSIFPNRTQVLNQLNTSMKQDKLDAGDLLGTFQVLRQPVAKTGVQTADEPTTQEPQDD